MIGKYENVEKSRGGVDYYWKFYRLDNLIKYFTRLCDRVLKDHTFYHKLFSEIDIQLNVSFISNYLIRLKWIDCLKKNFMKILNNGNAIKRLNMKFAKFISIIYHRISKQILIL